LLLLLEEGEEEEELHWNLNIVDKESHCEENDKAVFKGLNKCFSLDFFLCRNINMSLLGCECESQLIAQFVV
jgi:hypothetical protein